MSLVSLAHHLHASIGGIQGLHLAVELDALHSTEGKICFHSKLEDAYASVRTDKVMGAMANQPSKLKNSITVGV